MFPWIEVCNSGVIFLRVVHRLELTIFFSLRTPIGFNNLGLPERNLLAMQLFFSHRPTMD